MAKITLDIDDKHVQTVLTILKSLKTGLIKGIHTHKQTAQPVSSSLNNKSTKQKYLSSSQYKQKQQQILEDDFLASKTSTGKYLDPTKFKEKLRK